MSLPRTKTCTRWVLDFFFLGAYNYASLRLVARNNQHGTNEEEQTAKRVLDQAAGVNMNTWIVGRIPVAHVVKEPVQAADGLVTKRGQKTFFLKGRIMAGQADLKNNPFGYTDFKWLTREELEKELSPEYLSGVRNMMADR